jgi:hypothetical protein
MQNQHCHILFQFYPLQSQDAYFNLNQHKSSRAKNLDRVINSQKNIILKTASTKYF